MNADHNAPISPQPGAAGTSPARLLVAGGLHGSKWIGSEGGAEPWLGDVVLVHEAYPEAPVNSSG
jgi:hypothetical protein